MIPEHLSIPVGLKLNNQTNIAQCFPSMAPKVVGNSLYDGFINTVVTDTFNMEPLQTARTSSRITRKLRK